MTYIATPDELIHCCFTKEANIGAPAYKLRIKKLCDVSNSCFRFKT